MVTLYKDHHIDVATVQKTKPGNTVCGDGHIVFQSSAYTICAVIDGLGSGKGAHLSAEKAIRAIQDHHNEEAEQILEHCNQYLTNERGAVITLLRIDYNASTVTYSNFGNIGFILYHPTARWYNQCLREAIFVVVFKSSVANNSTINLARPLLCLLMALNNCRKYVNIRQQQKP